MLCPESSNSNRRRFTHALTPATATDRERIDAPPGLVIPDCPCSCAQCAAVANLPAEFTPGCRCDACKFAHGLIHKLKPHHRVAKFYTARASGWAYGDDARLYAEVAL